MQLLIKLGLIPDPEAPDQDQEDPDNPNLEMSAEQRD